MLTESQMYETMLLDMIDSLDRRIDQMETKGYLTDADEIELAAVEKLLERLNDLEGF